MNNERIITCIKLGCACAVYTKYEFMNMTQNTIISIHSKDVCYCKYRK